MFLELKEPLIITTSSLFKALFGASNLIRTVEPLFNHKEKPCKRENMENRYHFNFQALKRCTHISLILKTFDPEKKKGSIDTLRL